MPKAVMSGRLEKATVFSIQIGTALIEQKLFAGIFSKLFLFTRKEKAGAP